MAKDTAKAPDKIKAEAAEAVAEGAHEPKVPVPEPKYTASEISANAQRLFGCSVDIATAALAFSSVSEATLTDAKRIIKGFAERKV